MKKLLFSALLLLLSFWSFAQYYRAESDLQRLFKTDSSVLNFNIDNYNFLWNNEFFSPIIEGYTLIGYNIQPAFEYHFTPEIKAKAGIYLLNYFGEGKYTHCLPIYSVTWHKNNLAVTMGTINGASFHRLPDPVMNRERQLTNINENGMQIVYNTSNLFVDVWVDWQAFIFQNDMEKEEIFGGLSVDWQAFKNQSLAVSIPASWVIYHKGGQIDISPEPMKLLYHFSAGLELELFSQGFIDKWTARTELLSFHDNSPKPESIYEQGAGSLSSLSIYHKKSSFSLGYWYGNQFLSRQGNQIYQCKSYDPVKNETERFLFTAELNIVKEVTDYFTMGLCGKGYFDTNNEQFDYTYAFTMTLCPQFEIWRRK